MCPSGCQVIHLLDPPTADSNTNKKPPVTLLPFLPTWDATVAQYHHTTVCQYSTYQTLITYTDTH